MDLSRREYPAMLDVLQPSQAVTILNERVKTVSKLNNDVADWLQERRRIEELYVQGLRKLARRQPPDETSELGIFTSPWQRIVGATESMADSHHHLARKIETDVERPLREFATHNRQMQQMSTIQGNLASLAKDVDNAQKKADKTKGRSRLGGAAEDVDTATTQWNSQAPYVFETLQAVDESRCNHLRDVLTQFQTHEVDQIEKSRVTAEQSLNSLLNVETADEIKTFSIRQTEGVASRRRPDRRESRTAASEVSEPATLTTSNDEFPAQLSSIASEDQPQEKKSRLGGLRRLGTVMRRKSSQVPPVKERATPKRSYSAVGPSALSNGSQVDAPVLPELQPTSPDMAAATISTQQPVEQTSTARELADLDLSPAAQRLEPDLTPGIVNGANQGEPTRELEQPLQPDAITTSSPLETSRDEIPPSIDPITLAEQEAAAVGEQQSSQLKLDILNKPISEENADDEIAMANVANALRAQAEQSTPFRRSGTNRGRREVRNTVFVPSPPVEDQQSAGQPEPSPPASSVPIQSLQSIQTTHQSSPSEDRVGSDAQSIHSSRSLGSGVQAIRHPDMQQPGLNSSVVETVSAWLEHGQIAKAMLIGELALAYNPRPDSTATAENIRLDNFSSLEKVAPNPALIVATPGKSGEYTVDVTGLPRTTVAFKYQVHLEEPDIPKQAPLIITPSWKVEPTQTSVIISYSANPSFGQAASSALSLSNVVLILHLDPNPATGGGKPSSCMSKPAGTFSRERSLIYWRMDELTLTPGAPPQKLLARFATDGEAQPGKIEARWEIAGVGAATGLGSGLGVSVLDATADPFADDEAGGKWNEVSSTRRLISGTYVAS